MLRVIIYKEILDSITSLKFVFTFMLCTLLILISIYTGIKNYEVELSEYSLSVTLNKKEMESRSSYYSLLTDGIKTSKRPETLSIVIEGIQGAVGRTSILSRDREPDMLDSKNSSKPLTAVFGALDLTFIVRIVLSLIAILFTYDAVSGEKERGTLKLMLSNDLPRSSVILGKMLGSFTSFLLALVIPVVLAITVLAVYPGITLTGDEWLRIGLIFILFLLYLIVFFMLGLFVSALTARSSSSLLILLLLWVAFVAVVPKVAVMAAEWIYPIPSIHEIKAHKVALYDESQKIYVQVVNAYHKEKPKEETNEREWMLGLRNAIEDAEDKARLYRDTKIAKLEREYQSKQRRQLAIASRLSCISPASAMKFAAMTIGRTGLNEYDRYLNSLRSYRNLFSTWAHDKRKQKFEIYGHKPVKPDLSDMPQHEFTPENLEQSLMRTIPDFAIMFLLIILFFAGAFVSFLKYDVR